ncbi:MULTISPECIES: phage portal protein [unclassified Sutcliffiella]|uniref:phage portal protein n=1 Tax=unclassified Sutcliffiella TaxID=2837532 RepID=UPI0030D1EC57
MEKRSIFQKMFSKADKAITNSYTQFKLMNGYTPVFTSFGDNAYSSDIVRSTIHSIASSAAKLKPKHVRRNSGSIAHQQSHIERLLSVRPNAHMNAYDFYYKIITQLYTKNNSFTLIQSDATGNVVGFYPINFSNVELLEHKDELYARFRFSNGQMLTVHYDEVIHLRRFYNENDMFGESNNDALLPTLELIHTTNEGIINAVKSSAFLRGLLKFTSQLRPEDMKQQRDDFVKDYMSINNNGGIAALDQRADYMDLKSDPKMVDDKQMAIIEKKVYKYFNVNENIVMSQYSEEEWAAFYESVIEPIAIQMSLEFTSKLFTDREKGHGNEIIFEANRLQYASNESKRKIVETLMPLGMLTINQGLEIFNLAPIEGGEKRLMSLNYVDADKANEYQGVGKQKGVDEDESSQEGTSTDGSQGDSGE